MSEFRYSHLNQSNKDLEMEWIMLDIKNMRKVLMVLINVYIPPQGSYKTACKQLLDAIKGADLKENAEIFLLGDFNINLKDNKYLLSVLQKPGA